MEQLKLVLLVALGGALGSSLRYLTGKIIEFFYLGNFPMATFVVNILGCFIVGILTAFVARNAMFLELKLLLITGFCGGFTTFSTFANESFSLMRSSDMFMFLLYTTLSIWVGILALWLGSKIA